MASSARSGRFFGRVPKVRRAFEWPANISVREWMDGWMDGNRGNLSFVAINLINQKTSPFLRDDRKRVVFFIYICEIFWKIGNLVVVVSSASILYIFVGKGNGNKFQSRRKYWRESIICRKGNYGLFSLGELFIQLWRRREGRGRYFVARREISYEEKGKGRFVTLDYLLIF